MDDSMFHDRRDPVNHPDMASVRAAHEAAGGHFFDRDSMRTFGSKVGTQVHGGRFFVTSEQRPLGMGETQRDPRMYTVREARRDGMIDTPKELGGFQGHATRRSANAAARRAGGAA